MDAKVEKIPASRSGISGRHRVKKLRVAAYCRVSTGEDSQQSSFVTQQSFYEDLIKGNPEWELVKIYADEDLSGTSRKNRTGFNEMMEDAKAGKIDYILTKSISRFARNTVDTLNCTQELRNLTPPVGIYFEKEYISTALYLISIPNTGLFL